MRRFRKILVAVKDPQARSSAAVTKAVQLARASHAPLELFYALTTAAYVDRITQPSAHSLEHQRNHVLGGLKAVAARLREQGVQASAAVDTDFPPHEAVIRHAHRVGADLIVTDCHLGRRAWRPRVIDWELLRLSPLPVLLVKIARRYRNPVVLTAIDPLHAFAKRGNLDSRILDVGMQVSKIMRGTIHAMHAYAAAPLRAIPIEILSPKRTGQLRERAEAVARKSFEPLACKHRIAPARQHLIANHPLDAIPEVALRTGADILVMGVVSRSELNQIFIGDIAERVIERVTCDVLVVKPEGFTRRLQQRRRGMHSSAPGYSMRIHRPESQRRAA